MTEKMDNTNMPENSNAIDEQKKREEASNILAKEQLRKKRRSLRKRIIIIASVIIVIVGLLSLIGNLVKNRNKEDVNLVTAVANRGDIEILITGSGTVSATSEYSIVPLVNGKILSSPYEEGDYVEKDALLYSIDKTDIDANITKLRNALTRQKLNLDQIEENVAKLTIVATASGQISNFDLQEGENVSGNVCQITDTSALTATIPFNSSQISQISVGDKVTVDVEKYMINLDGVVKRKSTGTSTLSDGSSVHDVEIEIINPGSLSEGTVVTATVHTKTGDVISPLAGKTSYAKPVNIVAEQSGKVKEIYVHNGDLVEKGSVIAVLENEQLVNSLTNARLEYNDAVTNLENAIESEKDYNITSPISGTVISKSYKEGDTLYGGSNGATLMVVADLSSMKFEINVDELDIANIKINQRVDVTADAIEGETFEGRITKISLKGTSANGVTNYPVEVTIDEPGNLRSGMNVNAEIVVQNAYDVICVPSEAVSFVRGAYYVTVVGEAEEVNMSANNTDAEDETQTGEVSTDETQTGEIPTDRIPTDRIPTDRIPTDRIPTDRIPNDRIPTDRIPTDRIPAQSTRKVYSMDNIDTDKLTLQSGERVQVEIGISDESYTEIKSGLSEGQIVIYESSTRTNSFMMMGGMSGMGGGAPMGGGGMGGGRMGGSNR